MSKKMAAKAFTVDLDKPLVFQVNMHIFNSQSFCGFEKCWSALLLCILISGCNFQVGHLGEQYQDWVHQPIVSQKGPRLFANGVLEVKILF
jgi:dihydroceramide fatty acyl 2-hydroxylase